MSESKVFLSLEDMLELAKLSTGQDIDINYNVIADKLSLPKMYEGQATERYLEKVKNFKKTIK